MNQSDIELIEKELNVTLPEVYKANALKSVLGDKELYTLVYSAFLDDPDEVIKINKKLREKGHRRKEWPPNFFAIGYSSANSYFFILLDDIYSSNIYYSTSDVRFWPGNVKFHLKDKTYEGFFETCKVLQKISRLSDQKAKGV